LSWTNTVPIAPQKRPAELGMEERLPPARLNMERTARSRRRATPIAAICSRVVFEARHMLRADSAAQGFRNRIDRTLLAAMEQASDSADRPDTRRANVSVEDWAGVLAEGLAGDRK